MNINEDFNYEVLLELLYLNRNFFFINSENCIEFPIINPFLLIIAALESSTYK